jgi:UDP-N-acetylglucosamine diphosphorylase/glucosamine-1-phosphate N-acetyltransferase
MDIILYEDEAVSGLYPVTLTRPAFDIRTAGYTLLEAVQLVFPKATVYAHSRALVESLSLVPQFSSTHDTTGGFLFLNARLAPALSDLIQVATILRDSKEICFLDADGSVAGFFTQNLTHETAEIAAVIEHHSKGGVRHALSWKLFAHPEDIIFFNRDALKDNLLIVAKNLRVHKKGLYAPRSVKFPKQFAYDSTHGPIVIGDNVSIAPFVVLKGPLIIRENSLVKEFTVIEHSTIGPVCKVGGEIAGSVMDGYSNKQHQGHLGDSYIGRWVNLATGTSISNLKNTYSNIMIDGRDSGAQFLGTVMGDHSKMGSNGSIFPGKIVGVAGNLFGMVTTDVPSFTTYVASDKLYELPTAVADKGHKAMAFRRGVTWTETDTKRLDTVFEMTQADRDAANVSKEKLSF